MGPLNLLVLGRSLISMGDMETAREVLKKGIDKEEMDPEIYLDYRYNIGLCSASTWSMGRNEEIESVYTAMPDYRDFFERLGLVPGSAQAAQPPAAQTPVQAPPPPVKPVAVAPPVRPETPVQQEAVAASGAPVQEPSLPKMSITSAPSTPKFVSDDGSVNITLEGECYTIGREIGEILIEGDASVSKQHARILKEGNIYFIEDAGSTNGTWVNQFRITKKVNLNRGDVVTIGKMRFRFLR
jgi:hypothetical protein